MIDLLKETRLLDYSNDEIENVICTRGWRALDERDRIGEIYRFVRDEIAFGYNACDEISASQVLRERIGQCNTKSILLMALLRGVGVPARLHGFLIDKRVQYGVMTGIAYRLAPKELVHTWTEVYYNGGWRVLEGVILDEPYQRGVMCRTARQSGMCAYAVGLNDIRQGLGEWDGGDTYSQKDAITKDLGIYENPDVFFETYAQKLGRLKAWIFRYIVRKKMNSKVRQIRKGECNESGNDCV